jgi:hypothetical protein
VHVQLNSILIDHHCWRSIVKSRRWGGAIIILAKNRNLFFSLCQKFGLSLFGVCLFFGGFWCIEKLGLPPEKKIIGGKTWAGPPTPMRRPGLSPRSVAISRLGEQGFARYPTKPAKFWNYPQPSSLSGSSCILPCIVPQVVTNLGPVT